MFRQEWLNNFKKRRHEIYKYKMLGNSYFQTAIKFGVSQGRVVQIVKQVQNETAQAK